MMSLLLSAEMTYSERASLAGEVALIGILIVFSVLAILMIALYIFQYLMYTLPQRKKKKAEEAAVAAAPAEASAPVAAEPADDYSLIAVLTAAVAAYESEANGYTGGFRVVSFRRKSGRTSWDGNTGTEN